jgi:hypothetical protein
MFIMSDFPKEEAKKLKKGDNFFNFEIINLQRSSRLISIVTRDGNVYTIHTNRNPYRVFKKTVKEKSKNTEQGVTNNEERRQVFTEENDDTKIG